MEEYGLKNNSEFIRFAIKQQVVPRPEAEQTTSGQQPPRIDTTEVL
jgi:hypothetical protein